MIASHTFISPDNYYCNVTIKDIQNKADPSVISINIICKTFKKPQQHAKKKEMSFWQVEHIF